MRLKIILLLMLLMPLLFAQGAGSSTNWVLIATFAIIASAGLLAMLYGIGYGMDIQELKFLSVEELYQLFATIIMMALVIGGAGVFNDFASYLGASSMPDAGKNIIDGSLEKQEEILDNLQDFSVGLGQESSKSAFCTVYSIGISMNSCGSYRGLTTPVTMTYQMVGVAVAELAAINVLLDFAEKYAFILLLPAGILLRTFRITRGAGGLLIGFALSIYLILPLAVVAMDDISKQALDAIEQSGTDIGYEDDGDLPGLPDVSSDDYSCDATSASEKNYRSAVEVFDIMTDNTKAYIYEFLINATMLTLVALMSTLSGLRVIAALAGAEVDVSGLARLA